MRVLRWMALALAFTLVGAACGDDGGSEAGGDTISTTSTAADTGDTAGGGDMADDTGDADDHSGDAGDMADDAGDMADDAGDMADDAGDAAGRFADCADIQEAMDQAQNSTSADPTTATDPEQLQADLADSIASLEALRSQLPSDLQDDADVLLDAIVRIDAAFAEIDYDVTSLDPSQMVEFATSMMGGDMMAMAEASQNLSNWVAAGCPG